VRRAPGDPRRGLRAIADCRCATGHHRRQRLQNARRTTCRVLAALNAKFVIAGQTARARSREASFSVYMTRRTGEPATRFASQPGADVSRPSTLAPRDVHRRAAASLNADCALRSLRDAVAVVLHPASADADACAPPSRARTSIHFRRHASSEYRRTSPGSRCARQTRPPKTELTRRGSGTFRRTDVTSPQRPTYEREWKRAAAHPLHPDDLDLTGSQSGATRELWPCS